MLKAASHKTAHLKSVNAEGAATRRRSSAVVVSSLRRKPEFVLKRELNQTLERLTLTCRAAGFQTRVAAQLEAQRNGRTLPLAISLIREKIRYSIETPTNALPQSVAREAAVVKLHREATDLAKHPPKSARELLGLEGRAAYAYFNAWQGLSIRWKGVGRLNPEIARTVVTISSDTITGSNRIKRWPK